MNHLFISHETISKQRDYILSELQSGRVFTNRDMQQIEGIANPWSRVSELRAKGYPIEVIKYRDATDSSYRALYWLPTDGIEVYHRHVPTPVGLDATIKYSRQQLQQDRIEQPHSKAKLIINNLLGR